MTISNLSVAEHGMRQWPDVYRHSSPLSSTSLRSSLSTHHARYTSSKTYIARERRSYTVSVLTSYFFDCWNAKHRTITSNIKAASSVPCVLPFCDRPLPSNIIFAPPPVVTFLVYILHLAQKYSSVYHICLPMKSLCFDHLTPSIFPPPLVRLL